MSFVLIGPKHESRKTICEGERMGIAEAYARKGYVREDSLQDPVKVLALDRSILSAGETDYWSLCTGWLI